MKVNNSFLIGIVISSCMWVVTIYLYYSLNNHTLEIRIPSNPPKEDSSNFLPNQIHKDFVNKIDKKDKSKVLGKGDFNDKYEKLKKDKHKKKYSQKLLDELIPVKIPIPENDEYGGAVNNLEDQIVRDTGYKNHAFNVLVSNNIGNFRNLPDTRTILCNTQKYDNDLPVASVIMCFYNEHPATLFRSINTILIRTPKHLLKEIILVDDNSDLEELTANLEEGILKLNINSKIKLIKNKEREGLIRSRVFGARNATGDVLIFLDSHIEVNVNWIEPLLQIIKNNETVFALPIIDIISADTFVYSKSPLVRGGFNWGLHFKWDNLPKGTLNVDTDFVGPFVSPTMAGGLFAVNRNYFTELGEYDMQMDIWGAENLEISFRAWQCGGSLQILPCSRIGHVFRKRRPYGGGNGVGDTLVKNSLRLANVWMDEYKEYFLSQQPSAKFVDYGNIDSRLELRKRLNCKPFSWYMKNIYPEGYPGKISKLVDPPQFQPWHSKKRNYINSFTIRLTNTTLCLAIAGPAEKSLWKRGSTVELTNCLRVKNQVWYETDKAELILGQLFCLEAQSASSFSKPILGKCHEMQGDQEWKHRKSKGAPIYNMATGTCLAAVSAQKGSLVHLDFCSNTALNSWDLVL